MVWGSHTHSLGALALTPMASWFLLGCENPSVPSPPSPTPIQIEFVPGAGLSVLNTQIGIGQPWLVSQTLFVPIHWVVRPLEPATISVVAPTEFLETAPRQLPLFLRLAASIGQPEAGFDESLDDTLLIDVAPVEDLYRNAYGHLDPYQLRIVTSTTPGVAVTLFPVGVPSAHPETPRENREAEDIALWLSGEHLAPEGLYGAVREELMLIRTTYGGRLPPLRWVTFVSPNLPSGISVQVTSDVLDAIVQASYRAWDSLNSMYELTYFHAYVSYKTMIVEFRGRQHPASLAMEYVRLPGFNFAQTINRPGDWSTLYPREKGGLRTYLFRDAWDDCQNGCLLNHYYYFRVQSDGVEFVGEWFEDRSGGHQDPPPDWWPEASQNIALYTSWFECCKFGQWTPTAP